MKIFLAGIWVFLVQEIIFFREGKGRERESRVAEIWLLVCLSALSISLQAMTLFK